jgi:hypothetical protein
MACKPVVAGGKDFPGEPRGAQFLSGRGRSGSIARRSAPRRPRGKAIYLPADSHRPADEPLRGELRSRFQTAFRDHLAVMLGNSHHDYTIVAYEPASDTVTIHNPYNRAGTEMYPDGAKVVVSDEGFFTLTTTQLANYFNYLYFELGASASR